MYDYILFDLDGTLTDSREGIVKSILYGLDKMGVKHNETEKTLERFIGPPLSESFKSFFDDSSQIQEAILAYRERYSTVGWSENVPYDGVADMLDKISATGRKLYVATSKPEIFAEKITDLFKLSQYFVKVCGATTDGTRNSKNDVIKYVLEMIDSSEGAKVSRDRILMVGDRHHDVDGAKIEGIKTLGVSFGFGTKEELMEAGAIDVCETPGDVAIWLCGSY